MAKRGVVLAAATASLVAAGVVWLLYRRPDWRRHVIAVGRHLLNASDHLLRLTSEQGKT
ncbi:MAG TPA: hypothetical protein PK794_12400 [Armatimonadota bacterium]|nr:hypothetical protein [Armatimonadota bacterium]